MARTRDQRGRSDDAAGISFLLSQLGAYASGQFAQRLEPLGIKPAHVGILRVIRQTDGLSQQAIGERLRMFPSRLVLVLDELERRGLVERRNSPADRRSYALWLTARGREVLEQIGRVSQAQEEAICAALSGEERAQLKAVLTKIVAEQKLTPGVHPGYRKLGEGECK
jgi:DNA-binding MarR family transcriptional regulator